MLDKYLKYLVYLPNIAGQIAAVVIIVNKNYMIYLMMPLENV
jgi:hypothetical protein